MSVGLFKIIVSTQEQYSVWPAEADVPFGWEIGAITEGTLEECLAYIGNVWRARDIIPEDGFVVLIDENDRLTVNLAGVEPPDGWQPATEPLPLEECLAFIASAWRGAGPLPEAFRPHTGEG